MSGKKYKKGLVFTSACAGMLLFGIVMISLGSTLPELIEKFQLNEARTGYLLTLLPSGILLGSLIFGPLVDWLSYKRILIAGGIFIMLGLEGIAFSPSSVLLHISVFCIGLGGGILNGVTNALVSEISDDGHSANLSLLGVFYGIGALGTPVILGLVKGIYSFESILGILGAIIIIPLLFFVFTRFPLSAVSRGFPIKEGLLMIKDPLLLLFGAILFFQSGIEGLSNNWTTSYLENIKEISASKALFILSSFVAALTLTRILLGKILRIYSPLKILVIGFALSILGSFYMLLGKSFSTSIVGMIAIGAGLAAGFPVILGYIGQTYTRLSGTAFSIVMTLALVGNVLANYIMGVISQEFGLGVLPYLVISSALAILVLLYFAKRKYSTVIN